MFIISQEPSHIHRQPPLVAHTRGWEAKAGTLTPGSAQVGGHGAHSPWSPPGEGALSADIAPVSWLQARVPSICITPADLEIGKVVAGLLQMAIPLEDGQSR